MPTPCLSELPSEEASDRNASSSPSLAARLPQHCYVVRTNLTFKDTRKGHSTTYSAMQWAMHAEVRGSNHQ